MADKYTIQGSGFSNHTFIKNKECGYPLAAKELADAIASPVEMSFANDEDDTYWSPVIHTRNGCHVVFRLSEFWQPVEIGLESGGGNMTQVYGPSFEDGDTVLVEDTDAEIIVGYLIENLPPEGGDVQLMYQAWPLSPCEVGYYDDQELAMQDPQETYVIDPYDVLTINHPAQPVECWYGIAIDRSLEQDLDILISANAGNFDINVYKDQNGGPGSVLDSLYDTNTYTLPYFGFAPDTTSTLWVSIKPSGDVGTPGLDLVFSSGKRNSCYDNGGGHLTLLLAAAYPDDSVAWDAGGAWDLDYNDPPCYRGIEIDRTGGQGADCVLSTQNNNQITFDLYEDTGVGDPTFISHSQGTGFTVTAAMGSSSSANLVVVMNAVDTSDTIRVNFQQS